MILDRDISNADFQQRGLQQLAKQARLVLLVVAAFNFGGAALISVGGSPQELLLVPALLLSGAAHVGLALWARVMPLPPVIVGFVLFAAGVLAQLSQGFPGLVAIVFDVILLALYLNGVQAARSYNEMKARVSPT